MVGIPLVDIATTDFGWIQTKGVCAALQTGTLIEGHNAVGDDASGVDGSVTPRTTALAVDEVVVGRVMAIGATTQYCVLDLGLEGGPGD